MWSRENHLWFSANPVAFARTILDFHPDPVQARVLDPNIPRGILNCTRQWGKSTILALKAAHHAIFHPGSQIVFAAPSARQSGEVLAKSGDFLARAGVRPKSDGRNRLSLALPNKSRIVAIPEVERTTRGFSRVSMLLIDEASRVTDSFYLSLRPMLATAANPSLWLLSTPNGQSGFFYQEWSNPSRQWTRIAVTAEDCLRISRTHLEEERAVLGEDMYRQEYCCAFTQSDHFLFNPDDLRAAFRDEIPWLFATTQEAPGPRIVEQHFYIGVDLGQARDFTTIAIIERRAVETGQFDRATFEKIPDVRCHLRHIERVPLNTSYVDVVHRLRDYLADPRFANRATLVMDATGVGKPVYDMLRARPLPIELVPASITAGTRVTSIGPQQNIPRTDLLQALEGMLRRRELGITAHAPASRQLRDELAAFSLRKDSRDDLIFAAALSVWRLLHQPPPFYGAKPLLRI